MCMADLFQSLEERVPFAVAHCNFHLRGEESDGDEALVTEWAREHSVPLHITSFDTEKYENGKKALEASYQKRVERAEKEGE